MTLSALAFLIVTGTVIPALAYLSKRQIDRGLVIPKIPFYAEAIVLQTLLLAGSFYVAARNRIIVFRPFEPKSADLALGLALFAGAVGCLWVGWRIADPEVKRRLSFLIPATPRERVVWSALSLAAAFAEEVAYRGVMVTLLQRTLRSWWTAALISSILFALAHLLQGWRSAIIVGMFGILFHLLVRATGGLYTAIAVHFAYDLTAGLALGALIPPPRDDAHDSAV